MDKNLVEKAIKIMITAHKDQQRKTDDTPYIIHPLMVAFKLQKLDFSDEVVATALIHDVLEDTDFAADKIKKELGKKVFDLLIPLSEDKSLKWENRKRQYVQNIKNAPSETKAISIADKIHNLESLLSSHAKIGSAVWKKFNRGKEKKMWFENEMLKMFKNNWSHPLIDEYEKLLKEVEKLD